VGYPKWKFKADGSKQLVLDPDAEHALGSEWADAPNAVPPEPVVTKAPPPPPRPPDVTLSDEKNGPESKTKKK
jgi:hypothetical protein